VNQWLGPSEAVECLVQRDWHLDELHQTMRWQRFIDGVITGDSRSIDARAVEWQSGFLSPRTCSHRFTTGNAVGTECIRSAR